MKTKIVIIAYIIVTIHETARLKVPQYTKAEDVTDNDILLETGNGVYHESIAYLQKSNHYEVLQANENE